MDNKYTTVQPIAKAVVFPNNNFNQADVININNQPLPQVGDTVEYDQYDNHDNTQPPVKATGVVKLIQTQEE